MIRINLLPFRAARQKENIRQIVSIFLLSLFLVLIGLGYYHVILDREVKKLKAKIEYTQSEVTKYNKIAAEVDEIKKKLAVLNKRLDVIFELEANRDFAVKTLDALANSIVEKRMWITNFETTESKIVQKAAPAKGKGAPADKGADKTKEEKKEKPPIGVKIQGIALDEKTISDFLDKLKASKFFMNVDQQIKIERKGFKQDKSKPDILLKAFQMTCTIDAPKAAKKEPEKDKEKKDKDKDKAKEKTEKKG